jgi:HlyD family secretion protein
MNRKSLVTLGMAGMIALAGCASPQAGQNGQATATSGTKYTVAKGTVQTTIIATGNVIARDSIGMVFQASGQVISVTVKAGDPVKAGQPLVSLDDSDLDLTAQQQYASYISAQAAYSLTVKGPSAEDLASAQAALDAAQAAYSDTVKGASDADIKSAKAALNSAAQAYNDLLKPPDENSVANLKATLDNAKAALDQAQAAYDRAYSANPAGIGGTGASLNLQQATNNWLAAKANYDKAFEKPAAGTVANAQAQIVAAQAKVDALTPTDQSIAQAASNVAAAQAKLAALTPTPESILQAQAKLDQARIAWQQAEKNVENATLVAPIDGQVMAVNYGVGDYASPGQVAVQVADTARPLFEVQVDETDMGSIRVGQQAIVQLGAYPNVPISATVESISPEGTNSGSSVTFKVDLVLGSVARGNFNRNGQGAGAGAGAGTGGNFPAGQRRQGAQGGQAITATNPISGTNPAGGRTLGAGGQFSQTQPVILIGLSGTGQVVTFQAADVIAVPNNALTVDRTTRSYVVQRVSASGQTETVPVSIGLRGTSTTQITDGLNEGDVILLPRTTTTTGGGAGGAFFLGGGAGAGGGR